jgi:hypothetical protein
MPIIKPLQLMEATTQCLPGTLGRLTATGVALNAALTVNARADIEVDAANEQQAALPSVELTGTAIHLSPHDARPARRLRIAARQIP